MNRIKTQIVLLFTLSFLLVGCGPSGCSNTTLETGGAYSQEGKKPDKSFYAVDAAFDIAYSAVDTVFTFEKNNRQMLWELSPEIKHTLDKIRPQAKEVVVAYSTARKAYTENPTPAGLTTLETVLSRMQQLATATQAALPKAQTTDTNLPVKK